MRTRTPALVAATLLAILTTAGVACTSDGGSSSKPTVVATTSILGDVVTNIVGDDADVEVLMPAGVDPHEFQLSAQQAAQLQEADIVIANGLGFEAGLDDAIDAARDVGVPVYEAAPDLDPLALADGDGPLDPHVFTDPARMADGVDHIADALAAAIPALDTPTVDQRAAFYADQLREADVRIALQLGRIPAERRVLVTNHDVFGYFADRYDFDIVGAVIPGGGTLAAPSSQELADLADVIREQDVPAIFADVSSPTDLADALAAESGLDVEVVPLHSESLGEPGSGADTYLTMIQANADAIAAALGGDAS